MGRGDLDQPAARTGGGGHRRQPPGHHRPEAVGRVRASRDARLGAHPVRRPGAGDAHRHPRGGRGLRTGRRRFHPLATTPTRARSVCVAAPALPDDYVRAVGELTTLEEIEAAFRETGLRVTSRHRARRRATEPSRNCASRTACADSGRCPSAPPTAPTSWGSSRSSCARSASPKPEQLAVLERARDLVAVAIDRDARTKELGHLALHDTLTGLPNRALAQDRLEHALARLADGDDDAMVAVLFVDLDRFKLVNDGLGHETGDELLVAVSRRLSATVRRQDTVARFGGDEFVVLCEDLSDERQAVELAERAAHAFVEPFVLSHAEVTVSASIGIAVTRRTSERASSLLQDADAAMYRAKRRGGARHELFDEAMHTQAVSRLLTERALRRALAAGRAAGAVPAPVRARHRPTGSRSRRCCAGTTRCGAWSCPATSCASRRRPASSCPSASGCSSARATCCARPPPTAPRASGCRSSTNVSARQLQRPDFPALVARALQRLRGRSGPTLPRGRRERAARRPRCNRRHAPRAQGPRRTARHRRLRHRRVVADLPAPVPVRRAEDRQHVRGGARPQRGRRRDRRRHHRHGPRARHDRGRRGRRDRRAARRASASSAATVRRATTSAPPEELAARRLVLVEQRPA